MSHALLSPSSASRWLACTPSARLEQQFPDKSGDAAKEGTLAHYLGETLLRLCLGLINEPEYDQALLEISENGFYNEAMLGYANDYATFVMERYNDAIAHTSDAQIFLEQKLDMTKYIPEGFGTGDVVIVADHVLDLIDLKYGKGVSVSADNNRQLMLYGLGALEKFDMLFDIKVVRLTIFQPRIDNFSTWEIAVPELLNWAETELRPLAALAFEGKGDFVPGKHCGFCKAKPQCKALADYNLGIAKYDFSEPLFLSDVETVDVLSRAELFINWINSVKDYALDQAVNNDKKWPGMKLVEGRSTRKYSDDNLVVEALTKAKVPEDKMYKKELLGITALEKELGKKEFSTVLEGLLIKPPGKLTLVPEDDKRQAAKGLDAAIADFAEPLATT